ncbi:MAG: type I 3-dehydroquinate dehydratase [Methanosarcinaceae archaeon]|nr:type I 3-dehydroquinate dehydratase [Methanosarcinaceae archaeon]
MVHIADIDLDNRAAIVASIDADPVTLATAAEAAGAEILELRLDLLGVRTLDDARQIVSQLRQATHLPCIATNRLQNDGGQWTGAEEDRITLLAGIIPLVDAVDIELSTNKDIRDKLVRNAREHNTTVIISSHDLSRTPSREQMKKILDDSFKAGADIAKLAVMPQCLQDVLNLLQVTLDSTGSVSTISMDTMGSHTRIIAPCYGSVLTYGAVDRSVAPGQLRVDQLRQAMEMIK